MENKKKIIYLITKSEWGGAQKYIFNLATNLDKDKYDVLVLAGEGNDELFNRLKESEVDYIKLDSLKRAISLKQDFKAFNEIYKILKKEKPDVIHLNSSKISILGSLAAKRYNTFRRDKAKVIYTVHGWVFNEPLSPFKQRMYFYLEKWTSRFKDIIICVSELDKQIATAANIALEDKLVTIHNGIDLKNLKFLNTKLAKQILLQNIKRDGKFTIIGTIANLYKTKGLNSLIQAAGTLVKHNNNLLFIVIGEGPERKNLENLIKEYNLEKNFYLTGNIDKAYTLLKGFDIFVLPSVKEGWPYTILEALAAEVPIIATKVGGIPEIINDLSNGILIKPGSYKNIAYAIAEIIDNPVLKKDFKKNSLLSVSKYNLEDFLQQTYNIYK